MPEMVIPLAAEKKSRANQLLTEANERINGRNNDNNGINLSTERLEKKFDTVIGLLSQLLAKDNNTVVNAVFNKDELYRKQASDMSMRDYQSLI